MADFTTHHILGQQVLPELSALKSPLVAVINRYQVLYNWGLQGPDVLFYLKPWKSSCWHLPTCGSKLHRHSGTEILTAMYDYAQKITNHEQQEMLYAYLAGFSIHYVLDKNIHPYVYYLQEHYRRRFSQMSASTLHATIERDIDTLLYQDIYHQSIYTFHIKSAYKCSKEWLLPIGEMYAQVCREVLEREISAQAVVSCFGMMRFCARVLHDRHHLVSKVFAFGLDKLTKQQGFFSCRLRGDRCHDVVLNLQHHKWYNLWNPDYVYTDSVWDLMHYSRREATKLLQNGLSTDAVAAYSLPFQNGKPGGLGFDLNELQAVLQPV